MAQRFYFNNDNAPYTPSTFHGAWDDTASAVSQRLSPGKSGAHTTVAIAETNASATWDVLWGRWVSDPLSAATIVGTVNAIINMQESSASADMVLHLHVWVTQGDSDSERGVLLTDFIDTTEFQTSLNGRAMSSAQNVTSFAVQDGDRIVVEVGYRAKNSVTTSFTGTMGYGGTETSDALDGISGAARVSWIEFDSSVAPKTTRFALTNNAAPITPGGWRGAWDDTASAVTKAMDTPNRPTNVDTNSIAVAETSATNNFDVALGRWVSGPLAAQTLYGFFGLGFGVSESSTSMNAFAHFHLYLMKPDGTVRATLITDIVSTNEWSNTLTTGTFYRPYNQAIASTAVTAGDYLVFEFGYQAQNTVTTSFTGTLNYGIGYGAGDIKDDGENANSYDPWVEFSGPILFAPTESLRLYQLPVEVVEDTVPDLQVHQFSLEVVEDTVPDLRLFQMVVEVLIPYGTDTPTYRPRSWARWID